MRKFFSGFDRLVITLGVGQMTGWGTTYFLPGVIGDAFSQATGLSKPALFSGITVMLLVSSAVSASAGKFMERGARRSMCLCSVLLSIGLLVLSQAHGPIAYFIAWSIFGVAMPFGLGGGVTATLVQIRGHRARRSLSFVLMMMSFSQATFWPLTAWLDSQIGWRGVCLLFAAFNLTVALAYSIVIRPEPAGPEEDEERPQPVEPLRPDQRRKGAALLVVALAGHGFVTWGIELHALDYLMSFGLGQALALSIVSLRGPVTLLSRSIDLIFGGRLSPLNIGMTACGLMLLGQFLPQLVGGIMGATLFIVLFSAGVGSFSVARSTMQLALFGPVGFATLAGRMGQPISFTLAISPPFFGYVIEHYGVNVAFVIAIVASSIALAAIAELKRMTRRQ